MLSSTIGDQVQTRASAKKARQQLENQQSADTGPSQSTSRLEGTSTSIAHRARNKAASATRGRINSNLNTQRTRPTSPVSNQPTNPNLPLQNQIVRMSPSMPRPGTRDAPALTVEGTDDPLKVRRYFEELENLFSDCSVTDKEEKRKWSLRYPDGGVSWEWKALPEASDDTKTFEEFKRAVLASYPGASDEERGTIRELNRLFKKYKNIDSTDLDEYLSLIRKFRAIKLELNPPALAGAAVQIEPLLTNRELVEKFTGALDAGFRTSIFSALHLKGKTRKVPLGQKARQDDLYEIDDVIIQGEEIVRGTMPGIYTPAYDKPRDNSSPAARNSVKSESLQQEMKDLMSEKMAVLLDTIKISQNELRQENSKQMDDLLRTFQQSNVDKSSGQSSQYSNQRTSGGYSSRDNRPPQGDPQTRWACFFCNEEGHMRDECSHRADLLELGRIILVNGRVRLPGNFPIPREPVGAVCEKDRIDYYYANKGQKERSVNLVQSTPMHIPGMINTATMSTYLSNQLDSREMKIAQLEKELQSMKNPQPQMYNAYEQSYAMPTQQSQFSQVGWTPPGTQYVNPMGMPMNQFLNQSQFTPNTGMNWGSQNNMSSVNPMTQLVQQSPVQPTLNELEAFVQTRRQQEREQQEK